MSILLLVGLGGMMGAMCRYAISKICFSKSRGTLPWATLTVNILGSLLLGVLYGAFYHNIIDHKAMLLGAIGFLGSFTTFSTFSLDALQLIKQTQTPLAILYILISITIGIALAATGLALVSFILH